MMRTSAALLKQEIEAKLERRVPAALSPIAQQAPRLHPVGNTQLNLLLGGGLPLGSICELTGPEGSGRSSIALSLLASASCESACAWIDGSDSLSPHSAAAAGVELGNLLWVRCGVLRTLSQSPPVRKIQTSSGQPQSDRNGQARQQMNGGSPHPREETKGVAPALEQMLFYKEERRRRKLEGTPGHRNQPIGLTEASQDQIEWERFNLRRVDQADPLRQLDRSAAQAARKRSDALSTTPLAVSNQQESKPWGRLDRALRASDQVLQSGGFRVVVLDLASIPPEQALRIPSATWFRYRKAAQESNAIFLLLTQEPCARSSAAVVLECSVGQPPRIQGVLTTAARTVEIARQRTGSAFGAKMPGRSTGWDAAPASMRAVGQ